MQDVNDIVAPVFVIDEPATIINAALAAVKVLFTLLVNGAVLPLSLKFDVPLTVIVPEFVIDPPD